MTTSRARQLEKLSMSLPQENQKTAQAQQQARTVQLQEQVKNVQPGTGGAGLAQTMGAQQAQKAGAINLQAADQTQKQQQVLGQEALANTSRMQRQQAFDDKITLTRKQRDIANRLSKIDIRLKKELLDDQLTFKKDEAGRTLMNETQMADWAITKATSKEELQDYVQAAQQVHKKELIMLETSYKKISAVLKRGYIKEGKELDRGLKRKLTEQKQAMEKAIAKKKSDAANQGAMWKSIVSVGTTAAAAYFSGGNPAVIAATKTVTDKALEDKAPADKEKGN